MSDDKATHSCPGTKYWVRPHQRIKKTKNGKTHLGSVYSSLGRGGMP
jgi:hypothetical protein